MGTDQGDDLQDLAAQFITDCQDFGFRTARTLDFGEAPEPAVGPDRRVGKSPTRPRTAERPMISARTKVAISATRYFYMVGGMLEAAREELNGKRERPTRHRFLWLPELADNKSDLPIFAAGALGLPCPAPVRN
jgi:hypothetical protein